MSDRRPDPRPRAQTLGVGVAGLLGASLVALLALPLLALALATSPDELRAGVAHPLFAPALWLSLRTTALSLALTLTLGTPLAWWLARTTQPAAHVISVLVALPVVIPPAVIGVALLQTFGRQGLLGPTLAGLGISVPFTESAVVLAQLVVSAPFYVQAAAAAFRKVSPATLVVARTLGASPAVTVVRVALPIALPGLVAGASLAWARALGEFGATLLFAGNGAGTTQTLPLAIFTALESDVRLAVVLSLVLAAVGAALLAAVRLLPGGSRDQGAEPVAHSAGHATSTGGRR